VFPGTPGNFNAIIVLRLLHPTLHPDIRQQPTSHYHLPLLVVLHRYSPSFADACYRLLLLTIVCCFSLSFAASCHPWLLLATILCHYPLPLLVICCRSWLSSTTGDYRLHWLLLASFTTSRYPSPPFAAFTASRPLLASLDHIRKKFNPYKWLN